MSFRFVRESRSRWIAFLFVGAFGSFYVGQSAYTSRLLAQCGNTCVGGCIAMQGDGQYQEYTWCSTGGFNYFQVRQAILGMSNTWVQPGPNVQPVKNGLNIMFDGNPPPVPLDCQTFRPQAAPTFGNPTQILPQTICPHQ